MLKDFKSIVENLEKRGAFSQDIESEKTNNNDERWHHTHKLLNAYRFSYWAVVNDITLICGNTEYTSQVPAFNLMDKYIEILQQSLQENIDSEIMEKNRSKTSERTQSLLLSCELLKDIQNALSQLRTYPRMGETYYNILFYSYFYTNDEIMSSKRSVGFKSVQSIAKQNGIHITSEQRQFYRVRKEAVEKFDSILWGLTSRSTVESFIVLYSNL